MKKRSFFALVLLIFSFVTSTAMCDVEEIFASYGSWVWDQGSYYEMVDGSSSFFVITHGGTDVTTIGDDQYGQTWYMVAPPATGYIIRSWSIVGGVYNESEWSHTPNKTVPLNKYLDTTEMNIKFIPKFSPGAQKLELSLFKSDLKILEVQLFDVDKSTLLPLVFDKGAIDIAGLKAGKYQIIAKTNQGTLSQKFVIESVKK